MEWLASCVAYIIAAIRYEYGSSGRSGRRRRRRSGRRRGSGRRVKYEYKARRSAPSNSAFVKLGLPPGLVQHVTFQLVAERTVTLCLQITNDSQV